MPDKGIKIISKQQTSIYPGKYGEADKGDTCQTHFRNILKKRMKHRFHLVKVLLKTPADKSEQGVVKKAKISE